MRTFTSWLMLLTSLLLLLGCNQSATQKSGDSDKAANAATEEATDEEEQNDGYYTGFDGTTDYSILIPNFRTLTIKDSSVASIEKVKVTLSEATITELLAEVVKEYPDFDTERFKKMLGREQTTYKITPLKAGKTVISTSGGRGGDPGKSQGGWGKSRNIDLVVKEYTADQLAAGQSRYTTDGGGGNLRACKSCHETGEEDAPPHELGRIMELSDKEALTWIKTGEVRDRVAKIQHTWEFSTDEEEGGIVPYLRSKQTHDVETLSKLYFEEMLANGGIPMGPPKDGEGGGTTTGTTTTD